MKQIVRDIVERHDLKDRKPKAFQDMLLDLFFGYPTEPVELLVLCLAFGWGLASVLFPADLMDLMNGIPPPDTFVPAYTWGAAMILASVAKLISIFLPRWAVLRWTTSAVEAAWFLSVPYSFEGIANEPLLTVTCGILAGITAIDAFRLHTIRRVRLHHVKEKNGDLEFGNGTVWTIALGALLLTGIAVIIHVVTLRILLS